MPNTYAVTDGHAEALQECPEGGLHEWVEETPATEFQAGYLPERRRCGKCNHAQVWRLKTQPNSRNAAHLGVWEDS